MSSLNEGQAGEARFAFVAHAGFNQIQIIVQVLQFLAQRSDLLAVARNIAVNSLWAGNQKGELAFKRQVVREIDTICCAEQPNTSCSSMFPFGLKRIAANSFWLQAGSGL